jgi:general secretion pathway protein A
MVLNYYKLAEQPFGVTPDPRFLYLSATHREAIASVLYSVKSGRGFTALIAEPGMGKTTVLFNLLQQLGPSAKTAFLFQSQDNPRNFLRNLLIDLGIEDDGSDLVRMQVKLNECLVRETALGKHFVVVVDEAQNLDEPVLEVVRMLSNFETPREKLMHLILAGQPQLAAKLAAPQLKQLRQRVSILARLKPFAAQETRAYIEHRLAVAGYAEEMPLFSERAFALIAKYSGGIPRNINNICFNAMSLGCAMKRKTIHAEAVEEVLADLDLLPLTTVSAAAEYRAPKAAVRANFLARLRSALPPGWVLSAGITALAALLAGIGWGLLNKNLPSGSLAPAQPAVHATPGSATEPVPVPAAVSPADAVPASAPPLAAPPASDAPQASGSSHAVSHLVAGAEFREVSAVAGGSTAATSLVVRVGREETLYRICMAHFGRYDRRILGAIRELNPALPDPRKIRAGQLLRIPAPGSLQAEDNFSAEHLGIPSAVEAKNR